ncbi:AhpD family alkylhydroperoxidase [Paenibacillus shirakamiensis]|uniref:AhpD family alkylhydroperoxidase n=1 Tax=Paenibacillus shirakamiensis TaxID=1265935 RepID=A0ABS4JHS8_9BACL|nr:carboxymuconolactone decarboxylase family protein [Paenibacillus shirakamiensis]MBP2001257.1 AhpD family alkylhydroperoxidase [Paenibacillus shirakamiensis]
MSLTEDKVKAYKDGIHDFGQALPDVAEAYHEFTGKALAAGELDAKTKQLIALGISLFNNNEICTFYHTGEARSKGASDAEIRETVAAAAAVSSGHILSQGVTRVQKAIADHG